MKHHQIKSTSLNAHGIVSMTLISIAVVIGMVVMSLQSLYLGLIGLLSFLLFMIPVAALFCSKCDNRENCVHWFPGKISKLLSKARKGPYTNIEIASVIATFLILIALPQYWLMDFSWLMVVYWLLMVAAVFEISNFVCTKCINRKCPMCKNKCANGTKAGIKP